ncbi:helix-turn-helix transcriptional regulator [Rubritalea tangerina]|uniref:Helix-turn-helix transcriptional regulator n=1 Tax=Rubritalea tangerina TaxID=430798 RepID=A0ABW4Z8D4_9BACT
MEKVVKQEVSERGVGGGEFVHDVECVLRAMSAVAILDGTVRQKKVRLMRELAMLTQSDCWVWTLLPPMVPGDKPVAVDFIHGGFEEDRFAWYLQAIEHADMGELNAPFIEEVMGKAGRQTTRLRQEIDPDHQFYEKDVYALWRAANIAPLVLSARVMVDGSMSIAALYRDFEKPLYEERERRLMDLMLSQVDWFHQHEASLSLCDHARSEHLSPRQRTILNLLLSGGVRKEIANQLGISENTVSGYIKELYRIYGVHSQAELLKRFRDGV